jgi:hypothetical protein
MVADNLTRSAFEIIEQIKGLPPHEQARVAKFIAERADSMTRPSVSVGTEDDGLPVIRTQGGSMTSQIVQEIESRVPVNGLERAFSPWAPARW